MNFKPFINSAYIYNIIVKLKSELFRFRMEKARIIGIKTDFFLSWDNFVATFYTVHSGLVMIE